MQKPSASVAKRTDFTIERPIQNRPPPKKYPPGQKTGMNAKPAKPSVGLAAE